MFRLEPGSTGFGAGREPELPRIDLRGFRTGCHLAARAAGGTLEGITERTYPGTFHAAVVTTATERFRILGHAHHPWVAVTEDGTGNWADPRVFVDPPAWTGVFGDLGFTVLSRAVLGAPLSDVDTSALRWPDWTQIRSWKPETVGRTIFNCWD
ncbi:hypothetical protein AB0F81_20835 [Actinoplanes sp. NPDC024001]|uniref:hypothetical protein n=1 Tax=Actinoplanes sp. NPDC024001 TaxID=3154598 RepID=UPI0033CD2D7F